MQKMMRMIKEFDNLVVQSKQAIDSIYELAKANAEVIQMNV